jgi:hypothetical protein
MPRKMADSMSQRKFYGNAQMHYMALEAIMGKTPEDIFHDLHLKLQEQMRNHVAFHAEMMGDIMYLHEELKQKDASQFVDAVIQKINGHVDNEHWDFVERDSIPNDIQIVPSVWSLQSKRNSTTNKITKHKARLNLHGGKQVYGMNNYETYAPVVTWFAIRLTSSLAYCFSGLSGKLTSSWLTHKLQLKWTSTWNSHKALRLQKGTPRTMCSSCSKTFMGRSKQALYGTSTLLTKMSSIGFKQSLIDDCVFYHGDIIFMVYVDDGIFIGSYDTQLQDVIKELQDLNLKIEDQCHPADYVGVNISKIKDGSYEFTQRALIDSIIKDVNLNDSKTKTVPAKVALQLHAFKEDPPFNQSFDYPSLVGKLNYLGQITRPDIMYATHQVAKNASEPRKSHGKAYCILFAISRGSVI